MGLTIHYKLTTDLKQTGDIRTLVASLREFARDLPFKEVGKLLEFDLVVEPHGRVPGGHVHPGQQESFEVREGVMRFRRGLRTVTAGTGDLVVVEPGTYHRFANAGDEPAIVRVRVTPALRLEELFETVAALAAEGRTLPSGMPRPLDLALFMREFEQEVTAPVAPALARTVMAPFPVSGWRTK